MIAVNTATAREVVHYQLSVDGPAVHRVRALAVAAVAGWALDSLADEVALCVSELVGNVVQHVASAHRSGPAYGPQADVLLFRDQVSGQLVLEVRDHDPRLPERRTQPELTSDDPDAWLIAQLAESGRGLAVVEASCDRLSWHRLPGAGKAVRCSWWLVAPPGSDPVLF